MANFPIVSHKTTPAKKVPCSSPRGMAHGLRRDSILLSAYLVAAGVLGYQIGAMLLRPSWLGPVTDWLRAALAWPELFVVLAVSLRLTQAHRPGGRSWWMFDLGLTAYACARTLWTVADQVIFASRVPSPSWPDLFFVLQYPFFFLAVLLLPGGRLTCSWLRLILDSLLMLGASTALSSYFLLVPMYLQSHLSLPGKLVILGYPLGDLGILFSGDGEP